VVLIAAAIVQSTALAHLEVVGVKVDFVLLLVVVWSIRRGIEAGLTWALLGGMALDVLSAGPYGTSVIACGFAAIVAGSVGPLMLRTSILLPLVLTPLASIVATLTAAMVMALLGAPISWPTTVALVVLPSAIIDSLAMLVVYPVASAIERRLDAVDRSG
jgi:rod shape-determining protein MreD